MGIKIGIDVGGTFTDGVSLSDQNILSKAKVPTQSGDLLTTILNALDALRVSPDSPIDRITVSTTLVTNAIVQNILKPAALFLFPGSGVKVDSYPWPVPYHTLSGEIDFRGREVIPPDELEWRRLLPKIDFEAAAIVGKFSHRNNLHEERFANFLLKHHPHLRLALGHEWGQPNFFRRALTTYLNLTVSEIYHAFRDQLIAALEKRGFHVPLYVLKGDGGVVPIQHLRPIESIYSGPAASILGAIAQNEKGKSYVVIDIGGTTTDIGLVLTDIPLMSSKGAKIGPFLTSVRSLAVRSIPVGGDSQVINDQGQIKLLNRRQGPAYCLGGPEPTPTDAMCYLNLIDYGNRDLAAEALSTLIPHEKTPQALENVAQTIVDQMVEKIAAEIETLEKEWKEEPAYKVWEVLNPQSIGSFHVVLSGGGGKGLVQSLGKRLKRHAQFPWHAEISNAIGTALARQAFSYTIHLDTSLRRYRIEETGEQGEWRGSRRPHHEVKSFLHELIKKAATERGAEYTQIEEGPFDFFPLVQGWHSVGYIVRGSLHITPGVERRLHHA